MIASQDRDLQVYLRKKPGQPILYLHKKTPVLEQPSEISRKTVEFKLNESFRFGSADEKKLCINKMTMFGFRRIRHLKNQLFVYCSKYKTE